MTHDHSKQKSSVKAAPSGRGDRRRGRKSVQGRISPALRPRPRVLRELLAQLKGLQRDVSEAQKANATMQQVADRMLEGLTPREREVLNQRFGSKT